MTTHFYIAGRFERRDEFLVIEKFLQGYGLISNARWLHLEDDEQDEEARIKNAIMDFDDVVNSDLLIAFSENLTELETVPASWARGGRHVELGIALAMGLDIVVIGPRENIFHYYQAEIDASKIQQIRHYPTIEWFIEREKWWFS